MVELHSMKNYNAIPILQVCKGKVTRIFRQEQLLYSQNKDALARSIFKPSGYESDSNEEDKMVHFELRIVKIKLAKIFFESFEMENNIFNIRWQIENFPESILNVHVETEETDIELSILYSIKNFNKFSEYLESNTITFSANIEINGEFVRIATAEIFLSKASRLLGSKVDDQVNLCHFNEEENIDISIGSLHISYQLNTDKKSEVKIPVGKSITSMLTNSISIGSCRTQLTERDFQKVSTSSFLNPIHSREVVVSELEVKKFQEDLFLVLNRNKALRTTQSEISRELKDRAEWLNEEAIWRRTLQEYAILSGKDPFDVQWRQWRNADTSKVVLRSFPKKEIVYTPILDLTIVKVVFFSSTTPYQKVEVRQIYVEYSFLNMEGPCMESEDTLPLPPPNEPAIFAFKKSFGLNLEMERRNCYLISEMIKDKVPLRISVVSEPLADYNIPIQTCEELGYSEVNFFDLVQLEENEVNIDYPILDSSTKKPIGNMTVEFSGILAMRKMALLVLAPEDYNIIV
ncbi:uncharacterized protein LOC123677195 [Harmonia axyridis]|uniref:uncharacterized protein LOC123677195 n=1 Tax=Harmonia axyridis TaxID=115357 RepID=UPI001E2766B5|nr:uncharacterized protein LOC123677195 [Harmonia axyridis]